MVSSREGSLDAALQAWKADRRRALESAGVAYVPDDFHGGRLLWHLALAPATPQMLHVVLTAQDLGTPAPPPEHQEFSQELLLEECLEKSFKELQSPKTPEGPQW